MIKIQPIIVPTKGEGNTFVIGAMNFLMNPENVTFFWQITNDNFEIILEGYITMNSETYSQWNDDDNFVVNWALNELNLQRDE